MFVIKSFFHILLSVIIHCPPQNSEYTGIIFIVVSLLTELENLVQRGTLSSVLTFGNKFFLSSTSSVCLRDFQFMLDRTERWVQRARHPAASRHAPGE